MKLSTAGAYGFSILMTAVMALTACGQKKDDGVSGTAARTVISGNPAVPTNPAGHLDQSFYLTGNSGYGSVLDFGQNVRDFLSAQVVPDAIGDITDQSVIMAGYVEINASNQINTAASSLRIWIKDSFALTGGYDPFYISMSQAVPGSASYNTSQIQLTFKDAIREVTLQGNISGNQIIGTLSFRNLVDAANSNLKSAQPMGYFNIATCALLNCGRK